MNTIDNLNLVLPFLVFESADDFYYLQILQRKKENPQLGRNSRVIKNYYIKSQEDLIKKYDEIKDLCRLFNARASLRLNKRSFEKVAFKAMINMAENMGQRDYLHVSHCYDRAIGDGHNDKNKKWIIDIDAPVGGVISAEYLEKMKGYINNQRPEGNKILSIIPSKTGIHLITSPFDLKTFYDEYPDIDVHRDNPTNLYLVN